MSTMSELLLSISHCEEVEKALIDKNNECHVVVSYQKKEPRHLPEPWNGNINTAEVLFISSNPSYNAKENFPSPLSDVFSVEKFFLNRLYNSDYRPRFYIGIKKCALWILKTTEESKLKNRICCTNIVHCKSPRQIGVERACNKCSQKWLAKVLQEFHGEYIVVIGRIAQKMIDEDMLKQ